MGLDSFASKLSLDKGQAENYGQTNIPEMLQASIFGPKLLLHYLHLFVFFKIFNAEF